LHQRTRLLDAADDLERCPGLRGRDELVARLRLDIAFQRGHERLQPPFMGGGLIDGLARCVEIAKVLNCNACGERTLRAASGAEIQQEPEDKQRIDGQQVWSHDRNLLDGLWRTGTSPRCPRSRFIANSIFADLQIAQLSTSVWYRSFAKRQ
jgi:hypothetical protein